jgi:hypothetical protein
VRFGSAFFTGPKKLYSFQFLSFGFRRAKRSDPIYYVNAKEGGRGDHERDGGHGGSAWNRSSPSGPRLPLSEDFGIRKVTNTK